MLARAPAKAASELELKFRLDPEAAQAVQAALGAGDAKVSQMQAVYFDTASHALRDGAFSLRVRRRGATYVQTLKHRSTGGIFQRDEWEAEIAGPDLDLSLLADTPAASAIGASPLEPAFTVDVERTAYRCQRGEAVIEASFDLGRISAGDHVEPVAEMELELLSGPVEELFRLASELSAHAPLTLAFESKAERGYRLAGHDGVAALKARNAAVGPQTSSQAAFQIVVRDALAQIGVNAELLSRAQNPEVLHQLRVGLRRFRAALAVFRDVLDAEGLNVARAETRWLAGELADARDIDVFLQRTERPDEIEESPGQGAFFRALRSAQTQAYDRALAAVGSGRFRAMLLRLSAWIETGPWLTCSGGRAARLRGLSVAVLAAPRLDKLDHRVRRRSRRFKGLDAAARHDLRKQVKKLRYATAFFGGAFPSHPKRQARYAAALRDLQDALGELQDMAVARTVALKAVGRKSGEMAFAAGLEVGRLTEDEDTALAAAREALKRYRRTKPFWSKTDATDEDLNLSEPRLLSA